MKKILLVEDRSKRRIWIRTLLKIYDYETYILSAEDMNQMIEDENPDFVYVDIKKPVNADDMKSFFGNLQADHRLRVRVINLSNHKLKFSRLVPFEFFDNLVNSIHNKIYKKVS